MSIISSQKFYHLRPNKYIDRNLFIHVLNCLSNPLNLHDYQYVGFGSFQFDDFKMIHHYLGISDMLSLESDPAICKRAEFNKPLKCIKVENTTSSDYVASVELDKNSIFWFDYTSPTELGIQFSDFCTLLNKANVNDIIRITLNAYPPALSEKYKGDSDKEIHEERLKIVRQRIEEFLPAEVEILCMQKNNYPLLLLRCIKKACSKVFNNLSFPKKFVLPLLSTIYDDGHQMLTFTGIILEAQNKEDKQNQEEKIKNYLSSYARFPLCKWDEACKINVPCLTPKEILSLNNLLPDDQFDTALRTELPFFCNGRNIDLSIENYTRYYQYYPNFHHVSF